MNIRLSMAVAVLLFSVSATSALASTNQGPPPPPPPPGCTALCSGPPPPPTPVPTVAPTEVAVQPVVDVRLDESKAMRGDTVKVAVDASTDDEVTTVVRYHQWKPKTLHSRIGSSGTLEQNWKVPKDAPLGKATIKITVADPGDVISKTLSLEIVP